MCPQSYPSHEHLPADAHGYDIDWAFQYLSGAPDQDPLTAQSPRYIHDSYRSTIITGRNPHHGPSARLSPILNDPINTEHNPTMHREAVPQSPGLRVSTRSIVALLRIPTSERRIAGFEIEGTSRSAALLLRSRNSQ